MSRFKEIIIFPIICYLFFCKFICYKFNLNKLPLFFSFDQLFTDIYQGVAKPKIAEGDLVFKVMDDGLL